MGPQDTLFRERYALFRTTRGFADLVFMRGGLRRALYLDREVAATCFIKLGRTSAKPRYSCSHAPEPVRLAAGAPLLERGLRAHCAGGREPTDQGAPWPKEEKPPTRRLTTA